MKVIGWRDRLFRKLSTISPITPEEFTDTEKLKHDRRRYEADVAIEAALGIVAVVARGWCYRYRLLEDGRRTVFNFWLPGDLINLTPMAPGLVSHTAAVREAELVHIVDADFIAMCDASPALGAAFAANERLDNLLLANQVLRLGRLSAMERVAHLFLELWDRLSLVGLADGEQFPLPFTYGTLADALGLSNVHVSRTLGQLRDRGLIETKRRTVLLKAPQQLADLTEYDPIGTCIGPND